MNSKPDSDLPKLAAPGQQAPAAASIQHFAQLSQLSESEIKQLHGIGPNALKQLRRGLATKGLAFAKRKNERS